MSQSHLIHEFIGILTGEEWLSWSYQFKKYTVKLGVKEPFDKEQIGVKEPFPMTNCQFTS